MTRTNREAQQIRLQNLVLGVVGCLDGLPCRIPRLANRRRPTVRAYVYVELDGSGERVSTVRRKRALRHNQRMVRTSQAKRRTHAGFRLTLFIMVSMQPIPNKA